MAVVRIPAEERTIHDEQGIRAELAPLGVEYERWDLSRVPEDASAEAVLEVYAAEIAHGVFCHLTDAQRQKIQECHQEPHALRVGCGRVVQCKQQCVPLRIVKTTLQYLPA